MNVERMRRNVARQRAMRRRPALVCTDGMVLEAGFYADLTIPDGVTVTLGPYDPFHDHSRASVRWAGVKF